MKLKNNQNPLKRNLSLLMGIVAGFSLLATIVLFTIGTAEAETFAWVGFIVTMICSTLLTAETSTKKSCSTNPAMK